MIFIAFSEKQHLLLSNVENKTAAHLLVEHFDDPELIQKLCEKDPMAFEVRDKAGNTPLHYGIMLKKVNSIPLLIKYAPESVIAKNKEGSIPAHYCTPTTIGFFSENAEILTIKNTQGETVQSILFKSFDSEHKQECVIC